MNQNMPSQKEQDMVAWYVLERPLVRPDTSYQKAARCIALFLLANCGITYYYFWAYIKYDHFYRKHYRTSPDYQELLSNAEQAGLSNYDVEQLYAILGVARPDCL